MPSESRLTSYTILEHKPGPLSETPTRKVGTYPVPADVAKKGKEAVYEWFIRRFKEDLWNE